MDQLTGGCLCGSVRYVLDPSGGIADFCHCARCRRASGAATVAWLQIPPGQFTITTGEARSHAGTGGMRRHFCGSCGSQLYMTDPEGRSVGVTMGTLDTIDAVRPTAHGWDSARPTWLMLCDELPRFTGDPPYDG